MNCKDCGKEMSKGVSVEKDTRHISVIYYCLNGPDKCPNGYFEEVKLA